MYAVDLETEADWWEVEALYDLCFAPGREALSSYRLRNNTSPVPELCLLSRDDDGVLAGAVRVWPVKVSTHQALLLGPIAVHPTRQGEGLGGVLIGEVIQRAGAYGWQRILLVGDLPYYQRFGFVKLTCVEMPPPTNPDRVLGVALTPNAWDGVAGIVHRAD